MSSLFLRIHVPKILIRNLCTLETPLNTLSDVPHVPVMVKEVLENLQPSKNHKILDMTFGAGGHSRQILQSAANIKLYALDRDPTAHEYANKLNEEYPNQVVPLLGRFSDLPNLLRTHNITTNYFDGILFDFGCSSMQYDCAHRGFSISKNGPLDMRMDGDLHKDQPTVFDVLAKATEIDLSRIIKIYGEEKGAKKIARAIVETRNMFKPIQTTKELANVIANCLSEEHRQDKLQRLSHIATKTFQALRIFVNNELNEINYAMIISDKILKKYGHLVAITFHSLEDKIVKRHLMGNIINNVANPVPLKYHNQTLLHDVESLEVLSQSNWQQLNKHVITPINDEIKQNPRCRSAKLRAAIKVN